MHYSVATDKKIISVLLYAIPIIFLSVNYILITASGEDVLQGAGAHGSPLYGLLHAFGYNARLSDMYAYTVINFYDYQFCFGIDTIFRLIDVAFGAGMMLLMTAVVVGGAPRLNLRDGSVFALMMPVIFLSPFCKSLYMGLSHIHNYLVIEFFSVLFFVPFAMSLVGKGPKPKTVAMFIVGFLFGFSSNVTPVAFLLTLAVIFAGLLITKKGRPKALLKSWIISAVLGILLACVIMYVMGNGVSHYTGGGYALATDYISLQNALKSPLWVLRHIIANFNTMGRCLLIMAVAALCELAAYKKGVFGENNPGMLKFSAACLLFVIMHTLCESQILMSSLLRLTMSAYLAAVMSVSAMALRMAKIALPSRWKAMACAAILIICTLMTADMAKFRIEYNRNAAEAQIIKTSEGPNAYIPRNYTVIDQPSIYRRYSDLHSTISAFAEANVACA